MPPTLVFYGELRRRPRKAAETKAPAADSKVALVEANDPEKGSMTGGGKDVGGESTILGRVLIKGR